MEILGSSTTVGTKHQHGYMGETGEGRKARQADLGAAEIGGEEAVAAARRGLARRTFSLTKKATGSQFVRKQRGIRLPVEQGLYGRKFPI